MSSGPHSGASYAPVASDIGGEPHDFLAKFLFSLFCKGLHDIDRPTAIGQWLIVSLGANHLGTIAPDGVLNLSADHRTTELNGFVPVVKMGVGYLNNSNFTVFDVSNAV